MFGFRYFRDTMEPTSEAPAGLGEVTPENLKRINEMFELSTRIMLKAKEGDIECTIIFFDRANIPLTLRAGAQMSVGGILEAMNMLMSRAGVPEANMERIREELATWALGRLQAHENAEAAGRAASQELLDVKRGIASPLSAIHVSEQ